MKLKTTVRHSLRRSRGLALVAAGLSFGSGASSAHAAVQGSIGALVEPILCDTRDVSLNHRFSPIGHVELDTGAYVFDVVDFGDLGSGSRLFTRSYHSIDYRSTLLGRGWTDNFDARIRKDPSSDDLLFTAPDGWVQRFPNALHTKEVVQSRSSSAKLAKTDDGGFVVTDNRYKWTINSVGTLIRVDYPGGEWVDVEYNGRLLSKSVGPAGPELTFHVIPTDGGDRLVRVTDATGLQASVEFAFDGDGRLAHEASANGAARQYTYWGESERIATIADDDSTVLIAAEYDERGRVVRLQDVDGLQDGQAEVFVYEDLPDGGIRTTVTHPKSRVEPDWNPVQIVTHDAFHRVTEERLQPTSAETYVGRYFYDSDDNQLSVDGIPCPMQSSESPTDGPIAGPLAIFSVVFIRVLVFIAYLIQLVLDQVLPTISI